MAQKTKRYTVEYTISDGLDQVTTVAKDINSFILYSRDEDIQGIITSLPTTGETIIHLTEDHNPRISLETLEKWVKQARKYDQQVRRILKATDKKSTKKTTQSASKKTTKLAKKKTR